MNIYAFCLFLVICCSAQEPSCKLENRGELSADQRKNFEIWLAATPDKAAVMFEWALDYAQVGNSYQALSLLSKALADTPWLDPSAEELFKPLRGCAAFERLVQDAERKYPSVSASQIVHIVPDKDLIPEGLAADAADGTLYLGSIWHRKIIRISPDGQMSEFVHEGQDGLLSVLGIRVDPRDRSVWAASELRGQAKLFHFDRQGKTLGQYAPQDGGKHEFNDLVVTLSGDVLVTDDLDDSVYKLRSGSRRLVRIGLQGRTYPNGIALASNGRKVYVAYAFGIVLMDINGGGITDLQKPRDVSLAQIDGLYFRNGSLIAIQNGFGSNRIVQLRLTPDGRIVTSGKLLEYRSANLDLPTTGAIYKDSFYFIVNSQIDHEKDGTLSRRDELQPVRIAKLNLN